ncbi:MAG: SpoIIE family protein phosphatase, partial [Lentisphaeria bacterium]|nr:SpoIIE family protein phosphatase [Lentisphaeria bacterium]
MRLGFHKWLLVFVVLAFAVTFGLSWYLHRKEAEHAALELLKLNLSDASNRVKRAEMNLQTITEMSAATAIAKARVFAMLIKQDPSILEKPEEMKLIRRKLDVDELHVADKSGKLIASVAHSEYQGRDDYRGFNLNSTAQSRAFMKAVSDPAFELVQDPQFNGAERKFFQYAGVARLDKPGVVQIGYLPARIQKARSLADIRTIGAEMRIGMNGRLFILETSRYPAGYRIEQKTARGLSCSMVSGKYLLTAMLPWSEVYSKDYTALRILFIGNLIVFILIYFLIHCLLKNTFIKEISSVTDSLNEISRGNFDKMIDTKNYTGMQTLVQSINRTVHELKKNSAVSRVETVEDITATLKKSLLPAEIPENKNYKFVAEIFTAGDISGNLCDFFKLDNDRVAAFFIDAAGEGIPIGLYIMKVKNLLRKALEKYSPEKALSVVNEDLYSNDQEQIPLKVFLAVLNLRSGVLMTFNAGHVDPVIRSANGNV